MVNCVRMLSGILLLAFLATAHAALPDDSWQQGTNAFERQEYESALGHFLTARDAGQAGPAVHYNIGVSQYKLALYRDAKKTFELLKARFPRFVALAEYNLGLTALKLNNEDGAQQHFRRALDLSGNDEALRALAAARLPRVVPEAKPASSWYGTLGFRAGYDDNVVLRDELGLPLGTTTESPMADLFGSLNIPISSNGDFRFNTGLYAVRYLDIDEFDQNAIRAGALYDHRFGGWRVRFGAHAGYGTLGGDGFDETGSLSARLDRKLTQSSSFGIQYRYDDISAAETLFAGIEGSRRRIDANYRWYVGDRSLLLNLQVESNDRTDASVSPARSRFGIDFRYTPVTGWGFEFGVAYRRSDYDDLVPNRTEDLVTLRSGITRTLTRDWQLLAEYLYAENDSSDGAFSYEQNRITVSVLRLF